MPWLIVGLVFIELCLLGLLVKVIQGKPADFFINRIKNNQIIKWVEEKRDIDGVLMSNNIHSHRQDKGIYGEQKTERV